MSCGGGGKQLLGFCSLRCAHQSVEERRQREQDKIDELAQQIFRLSDELRRARAQLTESLHQDRLVLGWSS